MPGSPNGAPYSRPYTPRAPRTEDPAKSRTISRLAVLKAAASFAATRQDIKSADVLRIAQSWLTWVQKD